MSLPPELITFFTSMAPVGELRLGIPVGKALGLSITSVFIWAVSGNFLITLAVLKLLGPITSFLQKKSEFCKKIIEKVFNHTRTKHSKIFNEIGALALIAFVAIPLPGSGGWTGALIAFLFGIKFWHAAGLILLGIIGAGIIVTGGVESILALANIIMSH